MLQKLGLTSSACLVKDLVKSPPTFVDGDWEAVFFGKGTETEEQKNAPSVLESDAALAELLAAETIIVATPMYNFNIPAALKAWFDLVCVPGKTFKYGAKGPEGLASGKKVYVVVSTSGTVMGSGDDFLSPYVRFLFGFIGIKDITFFWVIKGDDTSALAQIEALGGA